MRVSPPASNMLAVGVGMLGLAAAMGIGRFAFTPLMPLMQEHAGLTLAQGGWLAAANYAGYLAGALLCVFANPNSGMAARTGLAGVALFTVAMGLTADFAWWMLWRLLAGVASALALVGISAWALQGLARAERAHWAGWVFAGVGVGIAFAGLVTLAIGVRGGGSGTGWLVMGAAATLTVALVWPQFSGAESDSANQAPIAMRTFDADAWLLIGCYGIFGFGYIIPATFLPSLARQLVADPAIFGWAWPVFGLAAAVSTIAASLLLRKAAPRSVWALSAVVMALGVAAPLVAPNVGVLLFAAVAVGGTFMVLTVAAMQEARHVARSAAPRLIAAMTAAFAVGQLLGPIVVNVFSSSADALRVPSLAAAALLVGGAAMLRASRRPRDAFSII